MEGVLIVVLVALAVAPVIVLLTLVALAHLAPASPMVARTTAVCPVLRRLVTIGFLDPRRRRSSDRRGVVLGVP
jgi:hypothetical protein